MIADKSNTVDILILSDDVVGPKMAGPGIRAWEIAYSLAKSFSVKLGIPDYSGEGPEGDYFRDLPFQVFFYSPKNPEVVKREAQKSRVLVTQGYILAKFPFLKKSNAFLIVDLYVPFPLENLFTHLKKIPNVGDRMFLHLRDLRVFNEQILYGDHFLCANERQRDLFIGALMSLNRINPLWLNGGQTADHMISVVPFGIRPEEKAAAERPALRSKRYGLSKDDIIFLWGGVISNWFDPLTLVRAFNEGIKRDSRLKLFFLATGHPNPLLPEFEMALEARALSDDLGLTGKHVFFNEEWVDYRERGCFFIDADVGVSIHRTHIETHYAFRTRILDYIKYGLPIISTEGDYFSDLIGKTGIGLTVPPADTKSLTETILRLADNPQLREEMKDKLREVKKRFYWDNVTQPLADICRRTLQGEITKAPRVKSRDIDFVCGLKDGNFFRESVQKRIPLLEKAVPIRIKARIKRILRLK